MFSEYYPNDYFPEDYFPGEGSGGGGGPGSGTVVMATRFASWLVLLLSFLLMES